MIKVSIVKGIIRNQRIPNHLKGGPEKEKEKEKEKRIAIFDLIKEFKSAPLTAP